MVTYRTHMFDAQLGFGSGSKINADDIPESSTRFWLTGEAQEIAGIKTFDEIKSNGNIYVNYDGPNGNSNIYFYDGGNSTGAFIRFTDGTNSFDLTANIRATQNLWSDNDIYINHNGADGDSHLYFYEGSSATGAYLMWDDSPGEFVFNKNVKIQDVLNISPSSTPGSPVEGDIYMDSTTHKLRCYDGTIWNDLF